MKCLSLIQPWATLVVLGAKRYEKRGWHTPHRGPLAIHASRKFPETARGLCLTEPFRSALRRAGYRQSTDLSRGAVIGTVNLVACFHEGDSAFDLAPLDRAFGDFSAGDWFWKLTQPLCLAVPIPATGRLGLFDIPLDDRATMAAREPAAQAREAGGDPCLRRGLA